MNIDSVLHYQYSFVAINALVYESGVEDSVTLTDRGSR